MIRKMVETDLVQVVDLENICFPKGGWTIEQFHYELFGKSVLKLVGI